MVGTLSARALSTSASPLVGNSNASSRTHQTFHQKSAKLKKNRNSSSNLGAGFGANSECSLCRSRLSELRCIRYLRGPWGFEKIVLNIPEYLRKIGTPQLNRAFLFFD